MPQSHHQMHGEQSMKSWLPHKIRTHGITIKGRNGDIQLQQYSDASSATGSNGRSIRGGITLLDNTPLVWQSKQQTQVTTSTCHSEYIAAYEATLQACPFRT
jgi:hypothetical protein